jgi:hypothetical protein
MGSIWPETAELAKFGKFLDIHNLIQDCECALLLLAFERYMSEYVPAGEGLR